MNDWWHYPKFVALALIVWSVPWVVIIGEARAEEAPPLPVETAAAVLQSEQQSVWTPGTVVSRQEARVATEVSGRLDWLADVGDRVSAGDALAQINTAAWQIQLRTDEAEIQRLVANAEYLARQVERFTLLVDANTTAASELDRLTMELKMLEQERAAAVARRDRTLYDIQAATVTAPFDGIVVERNAEMGEFAAAGEPVLRLVNTASLEIRARAPVSVARHVEPGDVVTIESGEGRITTSVRAIVPTGDERSRMVEVRAPLPTGDWIVGDAVRIALANGPELARVAIPRDALVLRDREVYVYKILDDATAKRVPVMAGAGNGELITVEGDLSAGDVVVIRGAERLNDGQTVRVLDTRTVADAEHRLFEKG